MKILLHFFRITAIRNSLISRSDGSNLKIGKIPKSSSILFVGIPGPGLIGILSLNYVIHSLEMEIVGEIEHSDLSNIIFSDDIY